MFLFIKTISVRPLTRSHNFSFKITQKITGIPKLSLNTVNYSHSPHPLPEALTYFTSSKKAFSILSWLASELGYGTPVEGLLRGFKADVDGMGRG